MGGEGEGGKFGKLCENNRRCVCRFFASVIPHGKYFSNKFLKSVNDVVESDVRF